VNREFSSSLWLQALTLALLNDIIDILGNPPNFIETALDLLTGVSIVLLVKMNTLRAFQPKIVDKIAAILALTVVLDLLPFIDIAPIWTLAVLFSHSDFYKLNLLLKTYDILDELIKILSGNPLPWSYIAQNIRKSGNYLREISSLVSRESREEVLRLSEEMRDYALRLYSVKEDYPSEEDQHKLVSVLTLWLGRLIDIFE